MLTLLILLAIRKIKIRNAAIRLRRQTSSLVVQSILLVFFFNYQSLTAQTHSADQYTRYYDVRHNDKISGRVWVTKTTDQGVTRMRIESDFILQPFFSIAIKSVEEATFSNGIMTFSSIDRKVNGKQKVKQQLLANGQAYQWSGRDMRDAPQFPIRYSVVSLYFDEPIDQQTVFSAAQGRKVPISQVKKGVYRLNLPNGNFNYYSYVDGVCTLIEIHHSLFQIQFVLRG
jgi:hypothetical protein